MNNSPGQYINPANFQQFVNAAGTTTVAMVGGATKGPLNIPTLIANAGQLLAVFGPPLLTDNGLQAAIEYLKQGSSLLYTRVAHSDVATAGQVVLGTTGGTPAVAATGTITFAGSANPVDGDTVAVTDAAGIKKTFEFDSNSYTASGNIGVSIQAGTPLATLANLLNAINNSTLAVTVANTTGSGALQLTITDTGTGVAGNVAMSVGGTGGGSGSSSSSSSGSAGPSGKVVVTGMSGGAAASAGTPGITLTDFLAATPGSWGNGVQVVVTTPSAVSGAGAASFDLTVLASPFGSATPVAVEAFQNVSLTSTDPRFLDAVLANGLSSANIIASKYIRSSTFVAGVPAAGTYTLGTGGGVVGADGLGLIANDYIGTLNATVATGLQSLTNSDTAAFDLMMVPGVTNAAVISAAQTVAANRGNCMLLIDSPFGITPSQLISWVNGLKPAGVANAPAVALSSGYTAIVGPWLQIFDSFNNVKVWKPPTGFAAALAAASDMAVGPWQPFAGVTYGQVPSNVLQAEYSPNQAQKDLFAANFINPFVTSQNNGIFLNDDQTFDRTGSALVEIPNRRTVNYALLVIKEVIAGIVWQPNDPITQAKFAQACNNVLKTIVARGGFANIKVVCNVATNAAALPGQLVGYLIVQTSPNTKQVIINFSSTQDSTVFSQST